MSASSSTVPRSGSRDPEGKTVSEPAPAVGKAATVPWMSVLTARRPARRTRSLQLVPGALPMIAAIGRKPRRKPPVGPVR